MSHDCIVLGAGVVGLSVARELARRGLTVSIYDRPPPGRIASWAASGILPPAGKQATHDPLESLRSLSHDLYPGWVEQLEREAEIAIELERCGGIHVAREAGEAAALSAAVEAWRLDGVEVRSVAPSELRALEPDLSYAPRPIRSAFLLPDEMQLRPPRLLKALRTSVARMGVSTSIIHRELELVASQGTVSVVADGWRPTVKTIIVAAGAWSTELLKPLNINLDVEPWRGQIVMWNAGRRLVHHVINEGPRYLVARPDGRLLAGSTVEDVGFDYSTTPAGIGGLVEFGQTLVPALSECRIELTWSGLRPRSRDGLPLIGRIESVRNLIVATGHFRSGIHLAPATAECVGELVCGESCRVDLTPFAPQRN